MEFQKEWGNQLREFRIRAGYRSQGAWIDAVSLKAMDLSAEELVALQTAFQSQDAIFNFTQVTISRWETGTRKAPRKRDAHLYLIWAMVQLSGIDDAAEADEWLALAGLRPLASIEKAHIWPHLPLENNAEKPSPIYDWGEGPAVDLFYGREAEQVQLETWLRQDKCRLIGIWGMGGQGKTTLAAQVSRKIADQFDVVIWRSVLNAPSLDELLQNWIQSLSNKKIVQLPQSFNDRLLLFFEHLRQKRCLIVLDNLESIMGAEDRLGHFRNGYESYEQLIKRFGETEHQSSLLLTSREEPNAFRMWQSRPAPSTPLTQSLNLKGLALTAATSLLDADTLQGTDTSFQTLHQLYSGNPLALILMSRAIVELYSGDTALFLEQNLGLFSDVRDLLDQHTKRLSELEQSILYWLAIEREPVTALALHADIVPKVGQMQVLDALRSLQRRSLVETHTDGEGEGPTFTLQNVIIEYLTDKLIHQACKELESPQGGAGRLHYHPLVKATAKSYVRKSQERLLLHPVAEYFATRMGTAKLKTHIQRHLDLLRRQDMPDGYTAGNILNLLLYTKEVLNNNLDLSGLNFSNLAVWQSVLQDKELQNCDLSGVDLSNSFIYENFSKVYSLALHPSGQILFAGNDNGEWGAYRANDLYPIEKQRSHKQLLRYLKVSANGKYLVSSGGSKTVHLWTINSNLHTLGSLDEYSILEHHITLQTDEHVRTITLCVNDTLIAVAGTNQIHLWDVQSQERIMTLAAHRGLITALAYSEEAGILASGDTENTIYLWKLTDPRQKKDTLRRDQAIIPFVQIGQRSTVTDLAFSPDGSWLAAAGRDGSIHLWMMSKFEHSQFEQYAQPFPPKQILAEHTHRVHRLAFSPDGKQLASAGGDSTIRLWQIATGQTVDVLHGHQAEVTDVVFNLDGSSLLSSSNDRSIRVWDAGSGRELHKLGSFTDGATSALDFSPDGGKLVSGSDDGSIRVWGMEKQECILKLQEQFSYIFSVAYSPDGKTIASASLDRTICIWSAETGALQHRLMAHKSEVSSVAYHPTKPLLASASHDQTVRLWDIQTGQAVQVLNSPSGALWSVAFSPDGTMVASCSSNSGVYLWSMDEYSTLTTLTGQKDLVWTVAFSPDGKWLAAAGAEGTITLWDLESRELVDHNWIHDGWVRDLAFSPNSQQLVSTDYDNNVFLWDLQSGSKVAHFSGSDAVAIHPYGNHIAVGAGAWSIQLWDMKQGTDLGLLKADGPFQNTNIMGITGISSLQRTTLKVMGAIEEPPCATGNNARMQEE